MAQDRKHPSNCEKATGETCDCGHCAGTQHGWVGAFRLIRTGTPENLRNFEQDADQRWRGECAKQDSKNEKQPKATLPHRKAAIDSARADLIKRLHKQVQRGRPYISGMSTRPQDDSLPTEPTAPYGPEETREPGTRPPAERSSNTDPGYSPFDSAATDHALAATASEAEQVEALGYLLGQVLNDVEKDIGPLGPETRQGMANHFWCELLVQLVMIIEESNRLLGSVPNKVAKEITKSRRESGLREIKRKVIATCVRQVWKRLTGALGLTVISDAKALLPALRALALLICKSPPRHPAVVKHCVDPLKANLLQETKERLQRVFSGLVPQITSDVGSGGPLARSQ